MWRPHLLRLALLIVTASSIKIAPLTTQPFTNFTFLASTLVASNPDKVYTVQFDDQTNLTTLNSYSLAQGSLLLDVSWALPWESRLNWQLIWVNEQLVAFPFVLNTNIMVFDQTKLTLLKTTNTQCRFHIILTTHKYHITFFSANDGNIYYSEKSKFYDELKPLLGSKHIGNTFLSLSPNNIYLCSTDQYTGYLTVWSVPNLLKLYQFKTQEKGIRAHSWSTNSKTIYAFGYRTGQFYEFTVENAIQLQRQVSSNLSYVTSCYYFYQTNEILAFSFDLAAVLSFSVHNYSYQILIEQYGAQKMQVQQNLNYFSVFNSTTASYYTLTSLCPNKHYLDVLTNLCQPCGQFCLKCRPGLCDKCSQNYNLSNDDFNCFQPTTTVPAKAPTTITPISQQSSVLHQSSAFFLNTTLSFINGTFQIPGQRQFLNVFFSLFSSFDHLMLYIYHSRVYGPNMRFYLTLIHDTIDYRFNIISSEVCQKYFGINFNQWKKNIDFKSNFSNANFLLIQQNGEGFFINNLQYFLLNIPLTTLSTCLAKCFFHLFFHFSFSLFLRKFQFFGIIMIVLLQGNVQLFFFAFTGDFLSLFSSNFSFKLLNVATILAGWVFLCLATLGLFSLYWLYKRNARFLLENCKGRIDSSMYFLTINSLMNMLRGCIHRILLTQPSQQAIALILLELTEAAIHIYCLQRGKIIESSFVLSLLVVSNISRVVLNVSFLFQSSNSEQLLDQIHSLVIFTTIILIFLGVVHSVNQLIKEIKKLILMQIEIFRTKNRIVVAERIPSLLPLPKTQLVFPPKTHKHHLIPTQIKLSIHKKVKFRQEEVVRGLDTTKTTREFRGGESAKDEVRLKKTKKVTDPTKYLQILFAKHNLGPLKAIK